ncbi:alcohol dehydrogenase catalytic domain-containing protein [Streptomyces sp. NPDC093568]|uniref:alcohol dehydrogenase catalytic domain-containing protein n=1 Tax=Streptomyces sp. NPDC093568 TaxID=3366041 RepID=UPI0037FF940C
MKAVVYRRYGGPEVLESVELPRPRTHVDSVPVRVRAAALDPADLALHGGRLDSAVPTFFPGVPGWDISGVVVGAGPGAAEFAPGDEVVGYIRSDVQHAHGGLAVRTDAGAGDVAILGVPPGLWCQPARSALPNKTA